MGLSQDFRFEYERRDDVEALLRDLANGHSLTVQNDSYIYEAKGESSFFVDIRIERFGIYMHRSGDYFAFVGLLLELLTGEFGQVTVEDH